MDTNKYSEIISDKLTMLRKKEKFTQEELAEKLGVTFQAISKWENGLSCPDILLLPKIAEIYGIRIGELFDEAENPKSDVPWPDDDKLRAVLYIGKELLKEKVKDAKKITLEYQGEPVYVESHVALNCGNITGDVKNNGRMRAGDIGGNLNNDGIMRCKNIGKSVHNDGILLGRSIGGNVTVNGILKSRNIEGNVTKAERLWCRSVRGNATAKIIKCFRIKGDVTVEKYKV